MGEERKKLTWRRKKYDQDKNSRIKAPRSVRKIDMLKIKEAK